MRLKLLLTFGFLMMLTSQIVAQRTAVNTSTPTTSFHIFPLSGDEPLRVEGFVSFGANDTSILVVDPANGTVRYMNLDSLSKRITLDPSQVISIMLSNTDTLFSSPSFRDSLASAIYNYGDTLLFNQQFVDSLSVMVGVNLLADTNWLNALGDSIDNQNLDSLTLNGTTLATYIEDGNDVNVDLIGLATDSNFTRALATDSIFIATITSDTNFYGNIADSLLVDTAWLNALGDSIDNQNLDSLTLNGTTLATYIEDGNDVNVDLIGLATDSNFTRALATDSIFIATITSDTNFYGNIADSLLVDTAWLNALGDSIDNQNLDSLTLNGTTLATYIEDGNDVNVDLIGLATDSNFTRALATDSIFIATITSDTNFYGNIADSLLVDTAWLNALGDSIDNQNLDSLTLNGTTLATYIEDGNDVNVDLIGLATDSNFTRALATDSIFIATITSDTNFYGNIADSLLVDTAWLNALGDSIDNQNLDSLTLNGTTLATYIEDGNDVNVDLIGLATDSNFTRALATDSIFIATITSDTNFYGNIADSLLVDTAWLNALGDSIDNQNLDSLTLNGTTLATYIEDGNDVNVDLIGLATDSNFTRALATDSIFIATITSDTNFYGNIADSLLVDTAWLNALGDSIDNQNLDSLTLNGTTLATYIEDGNDVNVDLIGLATDSNFTRALATDSIFIATITSDTNFYGNIADSLLVDTAWLNALGDSIDNQNLDSLTLNGTTLATYIEDGNDVNVDLIGLATDSNFTRALATDSIFIATITSDTNFYGNIADSLLVDTAWLNALGDSIDNQNLDSLTLNGTTLATYIEDGNDVNVDLIGLATDSNFTRALATDSIFIATITSDTNFYGNIADSLLVDTAWLNALGDSIDNQNLDSLTLNGTTLATYIEDGNDVNVDLIGLATDSNFTRALATDSIFIATITSDTNFYGNIADSLLVDTAWLNALGDSIDNQNLDSLTLNGTTLATYIEDGNDVNVDLIGLATDSNFTRALATDSIFIATITSDTNFYGNIADSLLVDTAWLSAVKDSVDSDVDSIRYLNDTLYLYEDGLVRKTEIVSGGLDSAKILGDSLLMYTPKGVKTVEIYQGVRDSLLVDTAWLSAVKDSIDSDVDSIRYLNDTLYLYEDGLVRKTEIVSGGLDSAKILGDSLLLYTPKGVKTVEIYQGVRDSLLVDTAWLSAVKDSVDTKVDTAFMADNKILKIVQDLDTLDVDMSLLRGNDTASFTLAAEYAGGVISPTVGTDIGQITAGNEGAANGYMNAYTWTTTETTRQEIGVFIRVTVPSDFKEWVAGNAIVLNHTQTAGADDEVTIEVSKLPATPFVAVTSLTGNAAWTQTAFTATPSVVLQPNETFLIKINLSASNGGEVKVGDITFNYIRK